MLASYALLFSVIAAHTQAPQPTPPPQPFDCTAPQHREFDFWIGEWDVVPNSQSAQGAQGAQSARKPASNVVEKAHRGCVVIENWDDRQLTFFPLGPDKVRQFSESLGPDGTWSINYDLIYTRRAKTK